MVETVFTRYGTSLVHQRHAHIRQSRTRWKIPTGVFIDLVRIIDIGLLMIACTITYPIAVASDVSLTRDGMWLALLFAMWSTSSCLVRLHAYELFSPGVQIRAIALGFLTGMAVLVGVPYVLQGGPLHWQWPAIWATCGIALIGAARLVVLFRLRYWNTTGRLETRIALVGAGNEALALSKRRADNGAVPTRIIGVYDDANPTHRGPVNDISIWGGIADLVADCKRGQIDAIVIALPATDADRIGIIRRQLQEVAIEIYQLVDPSEPIEDERRLTVLRGFPLMQVASRPLSDWQRIQKMLFDRVCSTLLLILLCPLLLFLAALVKLDSTGPVLFCQVRVGLNNQMFVCYKFRTMYHHMADLLADRQTTRGDPRVTRIGLWLRKLSLDELPQYECSLMRGDYGPRPCIGYCLGLWGMSSARTGSIMHSSRPSNVRG